MSKENNDLVLEETLNILYTDHNVVIINNYPIEHSNGLEVFNWLLNKSFFERNEVHIWLLNTKVFGNTAEPNKFLNIQKNQIRSSKEKRTTEQLKKFIDDQRAEKQPKNGGHSPIIIARYNGEEKLLDGRKRITMWVDEGNTEPHKVNFHEVIE